MKTKSPDIVTSKQLEKLRSKRYPRLVDRDGKTWLVDEHGVLYVDRPVKAVTPPSGSQVAIVITWIADHQDTFRRIRSAFRLKSFIEQTTNTYVSNGAACVALAAIGTRLVMAVDMAGDVRIIHSPRKDANR